MTFLVSIDSSLEHRNKNTKAIMNKERRILNIDFNYTTSNIYFIIRNSSFDIRYLFYRQSPHNENALIYQTQQVEAIYQATAASSYSNYFSTNWYFLNWENGSTSLTRQRQ
jgi:hypothetical protein